MVCNYYELDEAAQLKVAQIIHDCYVKAPYNYDWAPSNIQKYFDRNSRNGHYIYVAMSDPFTPAAVCMMGYGTLDSFFHNKIYKEDDYNLLLKTAGHDFRVVVYIHDICVAPSMQRQGYGKELLNKFKDPVLLFTYKDAEANKFYQKLGFTGIDSVDVKNRRYYFKW